MFQSVTIVFSDQIEEKFVVNMCWNISLLYTLENYTKQTDIQFIKITA